MQIEITLPCQLATGYACFLPGRIVEVPNAVAVRWIELGRARLRPAVATEAAMATPVKETTTKKRKRMETR
jgi:hypothetical protein